MPFCENLRNTVKAKCRRNKRLKLFYFGSICSQEKFDETVKKSKVKPSASAQNFEYALIKGFDKIEELDLTVVSAESIAMFPKGNRLFLQARTDSLTDNIKAQIVSTLNLPFFKQKSHAKGVYKHLIKWLRSNKAEKDKAVLVYGLYPEVVKKIKKACERFSCKCFAIITDIPKTMFTYTKSSFLKKIFGKKYRESAIQLQDSFDGYVYLTDAMHSEVAPTKPYIVVETLVDTTLFDDIERANKAKPVGIMYAGALYQKYGVDKIIEIFEKVQSDAELWLFGTGDYESIIIEKQKQNPKIHFFGRVDRKQILQKETEASLLLNIRNPQDEYTKYSFPSKMVEYMLSGTPIVTTKLLGIPQEYEPYAYFVEYEDVNAIAEKIDELLQQQQELRVFGEQAKAFIVDNKNSEKQAKKILEFVKKVLG